MERTLPGFNSTEAQVSSATYELEISKCEECVAVQAAGWKRELEVAAEVALSEARRYLSKWMAQTLSARRRSFVEDKIAAPEVRRTVTS